MVVLSRVAHRVEVFFCLFLQRRSNISALNQHECVRVFTHMHAAWTEGQSAPTRCTSTEQEKKTNSSYFRNPFNTSYKWPDSPLRHCYILLRLNSVWTCLYLTHTHTHSHYCSLSGRRCGLLFLGLALAESESISQNSLMTHVQPECGPEARRAADGPSIGHTKFTDFCDRLFAAMANLSTSWV